MKNLFAALIATLFAAGTALAADHAKGEKAEKPAAAAEVKKEAKEAAKDASKGAQEEVKAEAKEAKAK